MKLLSKKSALFLAAVLVLSTLAVVLFRYMMIPNIRLDGKEILSSEIVTIEEPQEAVITSDKIVPQPLYVIFSQPAKALNWREDNPKFSTDVIRPVIRGKWHWDNDFRLRFTPETDWVPGTKYKVSLPAEMFNPQVKIKDRHFSFSAPEFKARKVSEAFYEDPRNLKNKAATASFRFSYPLEIKDLKDKITVRTVDGQIYDFEYKLTDQNTMLHIVSEPLQIKNEENIVKITVADVKNAYNQKKIAEPLTATVKIPSSSSFFKINSISSSVVRNENDNDNPEQILFVNFNTAVEADNLAKNLELYFAPEYCYRLTENLSPAKSNFRALPNVKKIEFNRVPSDSDELKTHMYRYDINRRHGCLLVHLSKNLQSVEGFVLGKDIVETVSLSPYPVEAKMALDGAVLSLKGSKEIAFVTRGADELKATIARIDSSNLNHLVTQTGGDFSDPYFRTYRFTEDNISEIFTKTLKLNARHPAQPNYSSLDLSEYFQDRKGVFLIKIIANTKDKAFSSEESRLIVMTDLGIVVKDNLDRTHDVFISDVTAGKPVAGALVEVLGKNGLTVLSAETNAQGKAELADFSGFKNDKEAVVYKVSKGQDVSFLPISQSDRRLNLSRFDVGGEYTAQKPDALKAYIFSDRGIYRPGESGHLGFIVRQNDLNVPQKMPFVAEIRNPSGDVIASKNLQADSVGLMTYEFKLNRTAATGIYQVYLYAKDDKQQKNYISDMSFKVEEFLPDTLRIKAKWQDAATKGWQTAKKLQADVSLYNLYGNPAAGHKLKAAYTLIPTSFYFKEYDGYVFRDPLRHPTKTPQRYQDELTVTQTNAAGKGEITVDLSQFEQGTYLLQLDIDGLDAGSGRGVSTSLRSLVSPNSYLVGWKTDGKLGYLKKNSAHKVKFIAIDHQLAQIARDGLSISVAKRRYVSSLVEMPNGTYRYQMVPKEELISKEPLQIPAEGFEHTLKTNEPGEFILSIQDPNGQLLARLEYNVSGAANLNHAVDKDAGLGLKLNRSEYNHGDEIEMQITAPYKGYGLITIERDSVYAYKWFEAPTTSVAEHIKLPDTVEGNAYVNVAFFRDINSREIYMPSLSYAAAPFAINKAGREIKINLDVPQKVKPGNDLVVSYQTSVPSEIIVYGVNQGILQVAGYTLPKPLQEFMKKKALRVITSQIMDLIMPDIRILRMLAASGGDDSYAAEALAKNLNPFSRKTDQPVVFWSGILPADENGGTYRYTVPETFNGEIKVMAVAVSDQRFGSCEKSVLSRGDFALTPSGPLNVSPGDEFIIGLGLAHLSEDADENVNVRVTLDAGDGFMVMGEPAQTLKLNKNAEAQLKFRLKALNNLGAKELMFTAENLDNPAQKSRMPYSVSLRPSHPYGSYITMGSARSSYKLSGIEKLYPEFRVQQLSASASPLVLASGLLKYLDKFEHFCTEQSVSKIFPAVEVFFKSDKLLDGVDVYALFDDVTARLRERQALNGGFRSWGTILSDIDAYDSVYATHFLLLAKEHNFNVSENMLKRALSYCEEQAFKTPRDSDDFIPAYAAYVLTLNGKITTNYLLNLEENYKKADPENWREKLGASFMAASYKLLQNDPKARTLSGHYQSRGLLAEDAMNVYLNATYFAKDFKTLRKQEIEALLKPLARGDFTTDSAAWSILALNAFNTAQVDQGIRFSEGTANETPFPTVAFTPQSQNLTVSSDAPFYYVVTQQGFRMEENVAPTAEGLEISKAFFDKNGQEVTAAKLGDELTVKVTYRGLRKDLIHDVALVDLLPGCFEVVANSLQTDPGTDSSDIREDRVVVYVTADNLTQSFSYKVKLIAEGRFIVPPVYGSALYLPLVRANTASGKIEVRD